MQKWSGRSNVSESSKLAFRNSTVARCQFHQHFTSNFLQVFCKAFFIYSLCFLAKGNWQNAARKILVKLTIGVHKRTLTPDRVMSRGYPEVILTFLHTYTHTHTQTHRHTSTFKKLWNHFIYIDLNVSFKSRYLRVVLWEREREREIWSKCFLWH